MKNLTTNEKKLINDIFNNFVISGNKSSILELIKQMENILNKINSDSALTCRVVSASPANKEE